MMKYQQSCVRSFPALLVSFSLKFCRFFLRNRFCFFAAAQLRRISESDEDTMCESVKTDDGNSSNTVLNSSCSASRRVSLNSHLTSVDESSSATATMHHHDTDNNFSAKVLKLQRD